MSYNLDFGCTFANYSKQGYIKKIYGERKRN